MPAWTSRKTPTGFNPMSMQTWHSHHNLHILYTIVADPPNPVVLQEYFLHALSQPRPHASLDLMQDPDADLNTTGMRRSHSYHGLDPLGIPSAVYGAVHNIHASFIQAANMRHPDKQQLGGCVRQPSLTSRQLQQRGSVQGSFRSTDSHGNLAGAAGLGVPGTQAPSHVMSMLAEQVSRTYFADQSGSHGLSLIVQQHDCHATSVGHLCLRVVFSCTCSSPVLEGFKAVSELVEFGGSDTTSNVNLKFASLTIVFCCCCC